MTDLAITATLVATGADARVDRSANAGETITAGQAVYKAAATGLWMKADADAATAEAKVPGGVALNGAAAGQPLAVQKAGDITLGATLTAGVAYYLSSTPGGICPVADVGTGERVVLVGLAKSTTVLGLSITDTGVAN